MNRIKDKKQAERERMESAMRRLEELLQDPGPGITVTPVGDRARQGHAARLDQHVVWPRRSLPEGLQGLDQFAAEAAADAASGDGEGVAVDGLDRSRR